MNKVLLVCLGLFALASAAVVPQQNLSEDSVLATTFRRNGISGRGIILSSKGKKIVKNFAKQFEDGYHMENISFNLKKSFLQADVKFEDFLAMGLDNVEIRKLDIGYTLSQSVKFNFLFPNVNISAKLLTYSSIDALSDYGVKATGDIETDVEMLLENITFQGYFKYKMPIFFGSVEIYKFDASIQLDNVVTQFNGLFGSGKLNKLFNKLIEEMLLKLVNENQDKISALLKDTLVPFANSKLDGSNFWSTIVF